MGTLKLAVFVAVVLINTEKVCCSCLYGGNTYTSGDTFKATDRCNDCKCTDDGAVYCTRYPCPAADQPNCFYNGQDYLKGETFMAADGCNTCFCHPSGRVSCTEILCPVGK